MNVGKVAVAFAMALAVSGLCTYALGKKITKHTPEVKKGPQYVVAAKPLDANEVVKADDVTMMDWPAQAPALPGAFAKPADVLGRTLLYPMNQGQPITDKLVSAAGAGIGLAGHIPDGMRAIALRSDEVMGVAGFMLPGSHVDVLATYHSQYSPDPITVTVLQNVEVLAAGQNTQPDATGKPENASVVTLLLTPQDAEKAVLASTQGTIHFVMRSGSDDKLANNAPVLMSQLAKEPGVPAAPAAHSDARPTHASKHSASDSYTLETVLGDKQVNTTFVEGRP